MRWTPDLRSSEVSSLVEGLPAERWPRPSQAAKGRASQGVRDRAQ